LNSAYAYLAVRRREDKEESGKRKITQGKGAGKFCPSFTILESLYKAKRLNVST